MSHRHAVLWIDHHEAKTFRVEAEGFAGSTIESHRHVRRHPSQTADHVHPADVERYYEEVARALGDVAEILVVGPAAAKLEFMKHVHKHDRELEPRIVGVETVDHPTDGQLVEYARRYFRAADRMR